jgi:hypothetical protein
VETGPLIHYYIDIMQASCLSAILCELKDWAPSAYARALRRIGLAYGKGKFLSINTGSGEPNCDSAEHGSREMCLTAVA